MSTRAIVVDAGAEDRLRILENPKPFAAKAKLRKSEDRRRAAADDPERAAIGQLLREAITRAGFTLSEASGMLGVRDEAQFRRMLDGPDEQLGVHRLLTEKAGAIWDELVTLRAKRAGHTVERVIRMREE